MTSGRLRGRIGALAAGLGALIGCNGAEGRMRAIEARFGETVMTLDVADELQATPIATGGVRLTRSDAAQRRGVYEMTLTAAEGDSPVPLQQVRGSGDEAVRYGVEEAEGGSGGPEVTLVAERGCRDMRVRLRLDVQAEEGGEADLEPVLAMLAGARCGATGG